MKFSSAITRQSALHVLVRTNGPLFQTFIKNIVPLRTDYLCNSSTTQLHTPLFCRQKFQQCRRKGRRIETVRTRTMMTTFRPTQRRSRWSLRSGHYRPRTKHLCVKLHHFRSYVTEGKVSIHPISTHLQPADMLTKPLALDLLERFRKIVMGW